MTLFPTVSLADRLAWTLQGLARAVAACSDWRRVGGALPVWLITLAYTRVRRAEGRLQALLRRFREGRLRVGVSAGSVAAVRVGRVGAGVPRPTAKVPRRFAWLIPLVGYEAAGFASQLRDLLEDPEMVALLGVSAQARRVLAPVCRMLGIEAAMLTPVLAMQPEVVVSDDAAPIASEAPAFRVEPPEDGGDWGWHGAPWARPPPGG